jgi:MFS family permease
MSRQLMFSSIGFAVGPLVFAPVSEVWGRRVSMLPAMVVQALFSVGTAVSQDAQSIFITRFFAGVFGSAPVSNVSAALGDVWSREHRGIAMSLYGVCVVGGPTLAPVVGAALLVNPHLGWRWTEYITAIWIFSIVVVSYFFLPEVYGPVLLKWKAQRLRKKTGNTRLWAPHDKVKLDVKSIITKQLSRPLTMLFVEPMVAAICFYASFVFAILYLTLEVFPIVFEEQRGYSTMVASLPFLGLLVGVLLALIINIGNQPRYIRISRAAGGVPVPEARCPPMVVGGIIFVIGLFWFGWTASPDQHWILPVIATAFIGAGFNTIFQQCINFLVDTYGMYAASATAANTFLRSLMASGLPLAARPMIRALGIGPAISILGAIAALALPVPLLFMKYGVTLRKMSRFAPMKEGK